MPPSACPNRVQGTDGRQRVGLRRRRNPARNPDVPAVQRSSCHQCRQGDDDQEMRAALAVELHLCSAETPALNHSHAATQPQADSGAFTPTGRSRGMLAATPRTLCVATPSAKTAPAQTALEPEGARLQSPSSLLAIGPDPGPITTRTLNHIRAPHSGPVGNGLAQRRTHAGLNAYMLQSPVHV